MPLFSFCLLLPYTSLSLSLSLSLPRAHILLSCQLPSQWFSSSVWHIRRVCECSSELFNPRNAPNWKTARERHGGNQLSATIIPPSTLEPPPVNHEHIRQGAGLVDEKKFTNCLIIQISMIMNRYSTVREHGVQPELPPQHSSCESWLLISGWLSGTNSPCTPFKFPSCVFTVCTCNCRTVQCSTGDWPNHSVD